MLFGSVTIFLFLGVCCGYPDTRTLARNEPEGLCPSPVAQWSLSVGWWTSFITFRPGKERNGAGPFFWFHNSISTFTSCSVCARTYHLCYRHGRRLPRRCSCNRWKATRWRLIGAHLEVVILSSTVYSTVYCVASKRSILLLKSYASIAESTGRKRGSVPNSAIFLSSLRTQWPCSAKSLFPINIIGILFKCLNVHHTWLAGIRKKNCKEKNVTMLFSSCVWKIMFKAFCRGDYEASLECETQCFTFL